MYRYTIIFFITLRFLVQSQSICDERIWFPKVDDAGVCDERLPGSRCNQVTLNVSKRVSDFTLVTIIPSTFVRRFKFNTDIAMVLFPMPEQVDEASFSFSAVEEKLNTAGGECEPERIEILLKARSYPIPNPGNFSVPPNLILDGWREQHIRKDIVSDGRVNSLTVSRPDQGAWYALVYKSWKDPQLDHMEQQGLVAQCATYLYADLRVKSIKDIPLLDCERPLEMQVKETSNLVKDFYKCPLYSETENHQLDITIQYTSKTYRWMIMKIQAKKLPSDKDNMIHCAVDLSNDSAKKFKMNLRHYTREWHYFEFSYGSEEIENIGPNIEPCGTHENNLDKETLSVQMKRITKRQFFYFDYTLNDGFDAAAPDSLIIQSGEMKAMKFDVLPFLDIGGSLGLIAEFNTNISSLLGVGKNEKENTLYRIVMCLGQGQQQIPTSDGRCETSKKTYNPAIILNNTNINATSGVAQYPFPEPGIWYLTMELFCDDAGRIQNTKELNNRTKDLELNSQVDGFKGKDNELVVLGKHTLDGLLDVKKSDPKSCKVNVTFSITSQACLVNGCGKYGFCQILSTGSLMYSACQCYGGFSGWDCSDDSNMIPPEETLLAILLLTISNVLFLPSIVFAIKRRYYTEALVYIFTMFFSTFYHACDNGNIHYGLCIVPFNILQYCDFFCGVFSFWVTLVAMANLDKRLVSLLHIFGAIMIAFAVELDRFSVLLFVVPIATGGVIVLSSWIFRCTKNKQLYPGKRYLIIFLPIGLILAIVGLVCFAFLQTNGNYYIVHSVWHITIALSILCCLPIEKYFDSKMLTESTANLFKRNFDLTTDTKLNSKNTITIIST